MNYRLPESFTKAFKGLLLEAGRICIVSHKNPDGDALGASLALALFLKNRGRTVDVMMPSDFPDFLKWMPMAADIMRFEDNPELAGRHIAQADLIITLDINDLARLGDDMAAAIGLSSAPKVMIDHHEDPKDYAACRYSDSTLGSTCEMVYRVLKALEETPEELTQDIATCLYTGIMTDSGNFRFPKTTPGTHRAAADLIERKADNVSIYNQVFAQNSADRIQLLGYTLNKIKILPAYRTAYFSLSKVELEAHNYQKGDTEEIVNFALSIKNVTFAAIFTESLQEDIVKISFRSKGNFRTDIFAKAHFEGGGHINAAGGRSRLSLSETVDKFESCLSFYADELCLEK